MRQGNAEADQHFQRLKRLTDLDALLGSLTPSASSLAAYEPA